MQVNFLPLFSLIAAAHLTYYIYTDPPRSYEGRTIMFLAWLATVTGFAIGVNL